VSTGIQGFFVSSLFVTFVLLFLTSVFRDSIRFLDPPTLALTVVSAEKQLLRRRSPRKMHQLRPTKKTITMNKTTESLSLQNLHRPQTKNGGQNLRLFRRQELRKQHML
jgi:hypothetical protein